MDKLEMDDIIRGRRLIENHVLKCATPAAVAFFMAVRHEEAKAIEWARCVYNDQHYKL